MAQALDAFTRPKAQLLQVTPQSGLVNTIQSIACAYSMKLRDGKGVCRKPLPPRTPCITWPSKLFVAFFSSAGSIARRPWSIGRALHIQTPKATLPNVGAERRSVWSASNCTSSAGRPPPRRAVSHRSHPRSNALPDSDDAFSPFRMLFVDPRSLCRGFLVLQSNAADRPAD
jgi:hypothetical protein